MAASSAMTFFYARTSQKIRPGAWDDETYAPLSSSRMSEVSPSVPVS